MGRILKNKLCPLRVKEGAKPRFWRPRPVPLALKDVIEKELNSLQSAGVIEPVVYSEWAAPKKSPLVSVLQSGSTEKEWKNANLW